MYGGGVQDRGGRHSCLLNRWWISLAVSGTLDSCGFSHLVLGVQRGQRSILDWPDKVCQRPTVPSVSPTFRPAGGRVEHSETLAPASCSAFVFAFVKWQMLGSTLFPQDIRVPLVDSLQGRQENKESPGNWD